MLQFVQISKASGAKQIMKDGGVYVTFVKFKNLNVSGITIIR